MLIAMLLPAMVCSASPAQTPENPTKPKLAPLAFQPLPLGTLKPGGWLKEQLRIQADGLSGHLDEFWPDIRDSGWIGGKAEGWERTPYWLDGLTPLAWLLDDETLKKKVIRYVDYALEHQKEDGWLGPEKSSSASGDYQARDPWPLFVMFKVLTQYYEATGDTRVPAAMLKCMHQIDKQIGERPLFDWNKSRWQDLVLCVHWLYDRTGEAWLLDFADKAHRQGYDWIAHFRDLPVKERIPKWTFESHVVNNANGRQDGRRLVSPIGPRRRPRHGRHHARHARSVPRDRRRLVHRRRVPGRQDAIAGHGDLRDRRIHLLAGSVAGDARRSRVWRPPGEAGVQRAARAVQARHVGASVRPASQPGGQQGQ